MMRIVCVQLAFLVSLSVVEAFMLLPQSSQQRSFATTTTTTELQNNLLQNLFGAAFANDETVLSKDSSIDGAIDEGTDDDDSRTSSSQRPQLTATQQAWRQSMGGGGGIRTLAGTTVTLDLYLTGVPNKDPSNDLFAVKTNISTRDRAVGQELPAEPSVQQLQLEFLCLETEGNTKNNNNNNENQLCKVIQDVSGFGVVDADDDGPVGSWRLSDDGRQVRFRIPVRGYTRTVQTKGTIQKVYWSTEDERSTRTETVYQIPAGWLYGEAEVKQGSKVNGAVTWSNGVLKVEQSMGLLGVASKMVPCGKFVTTSSAVVATASVEEKTTSGEV